MSSDSSSRVWLKIHSLYPSDDFLKDIHYHGTILVTWNRIYYLASIQQHHEAIRKALCKYRINYSIVEGDQWDENMEIIKIVGLRWSWPRYTLTVARSKLGCTTEQVGCIYHMAKSDFDKVTVIKCCNFLKPVFKECIIVVCDNVNCKNELCNDLEKVDSSQELNHFYSQMVRNVLTNKKIVELVKGGYCIESDPKNIAWTLNWQKRYNGTITFEFNCKYNELTPCDYRQDLGLESSPRRREYVNYKIVKDFLCQKYYDVLEDKCFTLCESFNSGQDYLDLITQLKEMLVVIRTLSLSDDEMVNVEKYIDEINLYEKEVRENVVDGLSVENGEMIKNREMVENVASQNCVASEMVWIEYKNDKFFPITLNDMPGDSRFIKLRGREYKCFIAFEKQYTQHFVEKFKSIGNTFKFVNALDQDPNFRAIYKGVEFFNKCSLPIIEDAQTIMPADYFKTFKALVSVRKVGLLAKQFVLHGIEYVLVDCLEYKKELDYCFQNIIVKCNHFDLRCVNEDCRYLTTIKQPELFYETFSLRDIFLVPMETHDWFSNNGQLYSYTGGFADYWLPKPITRVNRKKFLFRLVSYNDIGITRDVFKLLHEENCYTNVLKKIVDTVILMISVFLNDKESPFFTSLSIMGLLETVIDEISKLHFCCNNSKRVERIRKGFHERLVEISFMAK